MAWKKANPEMISRFEAALPEHPDAEPRKMFGYPACFVKGNFFVGMHEDERVVVRLPGGLHARFPELAGATIFDPMGTGKGMKDWWIVPPTLTGDVRRLATFFAAAFTEVQKLPAKERKPKLPKSPKPPKLASARR